MITLAILFVLWGAIATYRLYLKAGKSFNDFNPYNGTLLDCLGWFLGTGTLISGIIIGVLVFLP